MFYLWTKVVYYMYINGICKVSKIVKYIIFANDTSE